MSDKINILHLHKNIQELLQHESSLPTFAWPGGYSLLYVAYDGGFFCSVCANGGHGSCCLELVVQDDPQWRLVGYQVHWEGPPEICSHCGAEINSAYGDPEEVK